MLEDFLGRRGVFTLSIKTNKQNPIQNQHHILLYNVDTVEGTLKGLTWQKQLWS